MNASAYLLRMDRAALMREGAIGRRWTKSQVDGEISANRL